MWKGFQTLVKRDVLETLRQCKVRSALAQHYQPDPEHGISGNSSATSQQRNYQIYQGEDVELPDFPSFRWVNFPGVQALHPKSCSQQKLEASNTSPSNPRANVAESAEAP